MKEGTVSSLSPFHCPFRLPQKAINDPIRFSLRASHTEVAQGQSIDLKITAHYLNLSPTLLYTVAGSTAFRLKLILPEGFVRTGGNYDDLVTTELSVAKPSATFTVTGYFTKVGAEPVFRLLRSHAAADINSLFVEKARLSLTVVNSAEPLTNRLARASAGGDYEGHFDGASCDNIWGWVYDRSNPNAPITVEILANGQVIGTLSANQYRPDLQNAGKGNGQHGFNFAPPASIRNNQNQSISLRVPGSGYTFPVSNRNITCAGSGTTNPAPTTPTPSNPANGCNFSQGQLLLNFYGEAIYAHQYNGV